MEKSSSVSTERGLDIRFRQTEFFFTGFFVVAEIQTPAASGDFWYEHARETFENRMFVFSVVYMKKIAFG